MTDAAFKPRQPVTHKSLTSYIITHPFHHLKGLGKTVEVLALILGSKAPASVASGTPHPQSTGRVTSRATLVVCAVSRVGQWIDEATSKSNGSLRILQYHGTRTR